MESFLWLALVAAFIYTLATLCMKRSSQSGVGPWRTTVAWNAILATLSLPFWFVSESPLSWETLLPPLFISFGFFMGQLFTCLAIHKGDVSVVTPVLGTKVVFVSLLAVFFLTDDMGITVWAGAILSASAILLMRGSGQTEKKRLMPSIILGLVSALSFAFFDIFLQRHGSSVGFAEIVSRTFSFAFLWSLLLIPFFKSSIQYVTGRTWTWLVAGGVLHASQALTLAYLLSTFGHATRVNILYSSRGFWSIVLVWVIGHWFSNNERHQGRAVFIRRMAGSCILAAAILLASWN